MITRSLFDQLQQIRASRLYDDEISDVATNAETQVHLEGDLNIIRTILKAIKGTDNWYDDLSPNTDLVNLRNELNTTKNSIDNLQLFVGGTDDSPNFSGTNYIDSKDIKEACIALDTAISFSSIIDKIGETISGDLPAETDHTLPSGKTYILDPSYNGKNLNVYLNGQLLLHDSALGLNDRDYVEISTTQIRFHMLVEDQSNIIYEIRK